MIAPRYRILVTGSRTWTDSDVIAFELGLVIGSRPETLVVPVIVHGHCPKGADAIADDLAHRFGLPVERHPADWDAHGKRAGFLRNQAMVDLGAAICLAFIRDGSKGATHTMEAASRAGIPVRIHRR